MRVHLEPMRLAVAHKEENNFGKTAAERESLCLCMAHMVDMEGVWQFLKA